MPRFAFILLNLALPLLIFAQKMPKSARLPRILDEVSGLVALAPDSIWLLNDSGNRPTLYRTDRRGHLRDSIFFSKISNHDWEELAADRASCRLFIGDFGNNTNSRRDLRIFIFEQKTGRLDSILFRFPDQTAFPPARFDDQNFDCEAMIFKNDSLHLFSKSHWRGHSFLCKQYVLPARSGRFVAELRDSIYLKNRVISGAALSQNGQKLVLVGYRFGLRFGFLPFARATLFSFTDFHGASFFGGKMRRQKPPYFLLGRQFEALDFIGDDQILLSNERLFFQKAKLRRVRLKK